MPYSSGLNRNIVQCLNDFNIPLKFSHTVVDIKGDGRVSSVVIAPVDEKLRPIMDKAEEIKCDCLLLSVGLLPENELAKQAGVELSRVTGGAEVGENMMTNLDGVFECGNVLHVHDLVDFVSEEAKHAGECAAEYVRDGKTATHEKVHVETYGGVRYTVPQYFMKDGDNSPVNIKMRVANVFKKVRISVTADGVEVAGKNKQIVTPGEMETVTLDGAAVEKIKNASAVRVGLEER